MPARRSRTALVAGALLVAAVAAVVVVVVLATGGGSGSGARKVADAFATAWSRGDDAGAARLTDRPGIAGAALRADRRGLDGARVAARVASVETKGSRAVGRLALTWTVPGYGAWSYRTRLTAVRDNGDWRVAWSPRLVHPALTSHRRLGTERSAPARAPILGRDGSELVTSRPVVEVGLQRDRVKHVAQSARRLAQVLGIDAATLIRQVRGAGPKQFVVAETLRPDDYDPIAAQVHAVPGSATVDTSAQLAPTREFARALLGGVGPATAEQVKASKGAVTAGDEVGQWGLEAAFDRRLRGTATTRIVVRTTATGEALRTLATRHGTRPVRLKTTLSARAQVAAEDALGSSRKAAAIVAVQPSSGDVLAVANRPTDSTFDRALAGAYAPGSTFKVITTAALLRRRLDPSQPLACPHTLNVGGRSFRNFEGEGGGSPTFADDFAISCNTAFISLAGRLPASALGSVARDYGVGRNDHLPFGAARSHVPPGQDAVSRAATMIGQDRIVATPLAMAGVAAAVADGRWRAPRLLAGDPHVAGPELPAREVSTLRTLMRAVVTRGSGTALASVPGDVAGKTGTAEFGGGDPPPTHAWFIAFRGDVALAVLVERGHAGGTVAAPIAARFFRAYG